MIILNNAVAERKMTRMAIELAERNLDELELYLIGIKENGTRIAQKIAAILPAYYEGSIRLIDLEINKKQHEEVMLPEGIDLRGKNVVLVDDVANSGKVMMYALIPIAAQLPAKIETLALLERQHKSFPIFINYVGLTVSTQANQFIRVEFNNDEMEAHLID